MTIAYPDWFDQEKLIHVRDDAASRGERDAFLTRVKNVESYVPDPTGPDAHIALTAALGNLKALHLSAERLGGDDLARLSDLVQGHYYAHTDGDGSFQPGAFTADAQKLIVECARTRVELVRLGASG